MSDYFNEAGEPLMDGSAMRYEMYLDSLGEYDQDRFYDQDEPDTLDPSECDHGSLDFPEGEVWCYDCDSQVGVWQHRDADGWPIATMFDQSDHEDAHVPEDQYLDSYMEDRISEMYI